MKNFFLFFLALIVVNVIITACNNSEEAKVSPATTTSSVQLPYTAEYTSDINMDVPDEDLLVVLNSYKFWETGDMKSLRGTMGDSINFEHHSGYKFNGLADSLMTRWTLSRDSLSSVVIKMGVWTKNHTKKDSMNYITTWYKEIDTYKTGKVDSANYADVNMVKNGKITWYSQYKQKL